MKTLILVRHAHRNKLLGKDTDNGLSEKGKEQAKKIREYFKITFENQSPILLSSPKKRCIETLEPLSKKVKVPIEICSSLDEGGPLENKIQTFLEDFEQRGSDLIIASSHGDWIPAFLQQTLRTEIDLDKGGWAQLEWEGRHRTLRWLLQNFDWL